jgi:hypothetical protein
MYLVDRFEGGQDAGYWSTSRTARVCQRLKKDEVVEGCQRHGTKYNFRRNFGS